MQFASKKRWIKFARKKRKLSGSHLEKGDNSLYWCTTPRTPWVDCWESWQHKYKEDDSSFCTWTCILQSLNLSCKTGCNTSRCGYQKYQMQCTDVCQCKHCVKRSAILGKKKLMRPTTVTMIAGILVHNKALFLDICYIFCCKQFDFDHLSCFCFSKWFYRILLIFAEV